MSQIPFPVPVSNELQVCAHYQLRLSLLLLIYLCWSYRSALRLVLRPLLIIFIVLCTCIFDLPLASRLPCLFREELSKEVWQEAIDAFPSFVPQLFLFGVLVRRDEIPAAGQDEEHVLKVLRYGFFLDGY